MGYMHIPQLYKAQEILMFRECWALEKVHGTSAHITYSTARGPQLMFFSGGENHDKFVALFDQPKLLAAFARLGHPIVTVYGEAYGGKQQGMSGVYGPNLQFIVFDVRVGESWLSVPDMVDVAISLGLEPVPYFKVSTDLAVLDAERDRPSDVAVRRGMGANKPREGVVLRPLIELTRNNGDRIMCKHKCEAFSERATKSAG